MASRIIDIRLGSSFDPKGVVAAETQIQILEKTVKGFGRGIGGVMGSVSRIIGDLFTGGLWSAGSRALGFIIAKFYEGIGRGGEGDGGLDQVLRLGDLVDHVHRHLVS